MGIKEALKEIIDSINNGKLVVFVGAGVSTNYGYPNWDKLTNKILEEIKLEKHKNIKDTYLDTCTKPVSTDNIITIDKTISKLGYATDEYLLFAQYLYEHFVKDYKDKGIKQFVKKGKKKFEDTIKKIIEDNTKKKENYEIIPKIFDLHPQHIITTNFDTLLEDSDNSNFKLIVKNTDLANSKVNNYIIKMHGDFENENIVLKESDYHYYRDNFKLIDNFVRSVFATHTILFLGFSANDPNFKQIYAWISKVLGKETRNAYFLSLNKKSNDIYRVRYLDNKYIKIINYEDLLVYHHDKSSTDDYGKRLEYCLDHLNINIVDRMFSVINYLKDSKHPQVWGLNDILKIYSINIIDYDIEIKNTIIQEFVRNHTENNIDERMKILFKILYQATNGYGNIIIKKNKYKISNFYIPTSNDIDTAERDALIEFNYSKLELMLKKYPKKPNSKNHFNLQRKAFLCKMIGQTEKAYDILTDLLTLYKKNNMIFEYFKTGYDRNYTRSFANARREYFDIDNEINRLSARDRIIYSKLFNSIKNRSYYSEIIKDTLDIMNKTIDLKDFFERGGMQYSLQDNSLKSLMDKTFIVLLDEAICSNYSQIFQYNIKSYFISYFTYIKRENESHTFKNFFRISKIVKIEYNYLYYAIQFLNPKDWNNILNYSEQNLELSKNLKKEMINNFQNISNYVLQKKTWTRNTTNFFEKRLCNFIILFSKTPMEITNFTQIIEIISPVIFKFDVYKYVEYLKKLCNKHKTHFVNENSEKLRPLFINMIKSLENENHLNPLSDFRSILYLFENLNFKKKLKINNKGINNIKSLIENEKAIFDKCIGIDILISIHKHCSINMKIKLTSFLQIFFKNYFKKTSPSLYFYLCLHKAIKKNIFHKTEESNFISEMLKQPLSEQNEHLVAYLDTVYQLKKENKVNLKEINKYLRNFSDAHPFYKIFLFEEEFSKSDKVFKARWLLHLLKNKEKVLHYIKNYNLDYKELIMKINAEIRLKENNKHQDKYRELLEFLLKHIDD